MMRCTFIFLLTATLWGCTGLDFGGDTEHKNLTYDQYVSMVGTGSFDPKGASEIYYRGYSTRDSYDCWWRLTIDRISFDRLLARMTANMNDPEYASYNSQRVGPVRHSTADDPGIPANWPRPCDSPPSWWQRPGDGDHVACTRWELQVDNTSYDGRSKGWYWLYDADAATLWIWT